MTFPTLAFSGRYDADGRRLGFQIRPSAKQYMRVALKSETANRRAYALQARLVEKAEASGLMRRVDPLERAAIVNRFRKPEMTDDEIDALVRVVEAYLSGRLCAADWRLWLRRFMEAEERPLTHRHPAWHGP
jgi:hypothetical protein